jgi:hypothetical protein
VRVREAWVRASPPLLKKEALRPPGPVGLGARRFPRGNVRGPDPTGLAAGGPGACGGSTPVERAGAHGPPVRASGRASLFWVGREHDRACVSGQKRLALEWQKEKSLRHLLAWTNRLDR